MSTGDEPKEKRDDDTTVDGGRSTSKKMEENENFEEEYDKLKDSNGLMTLCRLKDTIDGRIERIREKTLTELYEDSQDFETVRSEVIQVKKVLKATNKLLVENLIQNVDALKTSLRTYADALHEKLRQEYKPRHQQGIEFCFNYIMLAWRRSFLLGNGVN